MDRYVKLPDYQSAGRTVHQRKTKASRHRTMAAQASASRFQFTILLPVFLMLIGSWAGCHQHAQDLFQ
ncbi:hypothetical protein ACU4GD_18635 [Cupriavidus basilensis]